MVTYNLVTPSNTTDAAVKIAKNEKLSIKEKGLLLSLIHTDDGNHTLAHLTDCGYQNGKGTIRNTMLKLKEKGFIQKSGPYTYSIIIGGNDNGITDTSI